MVTNTKLYVIASITITLALLNLQFGSYMFIGWSFYIHSIVTTDRRFEIHNTQVKIPPSWWLYKDGADSKTFARLPLNPHEISIITSIFIHEKSTFEDSKWKQAEILSKEYPISTHYFGHMRAIRAISMGCDNHSDCVKLKWEIPEFGINIVSSGLTIDNFSHVDDFVQYIISGNQDSLDELTCNPTTDGERSDKI